MYSAVMEGVDQQGFGSPAAAASSAYLDVANHTTKASSSSSPGSIINLSSDYNQLLAHHHLHTHHTLQHTARDQDHEQTPELQCDPEHDYKTEPVTPTTTNACHLLPPPHHPDFSAAYPPSAAFTPSPSSSEGDSPSGVASNNAVAAANTGGGVYSLYHIQESKDDMCGGPLPSPANTAPGLLAAASLGKKKGQLGGLMDQAGGLLDLSEDRCVFSEEQVDCICDNLQNRGAIDKLGNIHIYIYQIISFIQYTHVCIDIHSFLYSCA